jgi:hypothetical protein
MDLASCLDLRERHGLRTYENLVLRVIFGPKEGDEKLRNDAINLYPSPKIARSNKLRRLRLSEYMTHKQEI